MEKKDLKTGMVVITVEGNKGVVMLDTNNGDYICYDGHWTNLVSFNDELEFITGIEECKRFSINSVLTCSTGPDVIRFIQGERTKFSTSLIWERKEKEVEMTLVEVCKLIGKNIKIVQG